MLVSRCDHLTWVRISCRHDGQLTFCLDHHRFGKLSLRTRQSADFLVWAIADLAKLHRGYDDASDLSCRLQFVAMLSTRRRPGV